LSGDVQDQARLRGRRAWHTSEHTDAPPVHAPSTDNRAPCRGRPRTLRRPSH